MANPTWPVYTFRVKLETLQRYGWALPYNAWPVGNETVSEADEMKYTRTTFFPLMNNVQNLVDTHGEEFTLYGIQAVKFKNTFVTGAADDVFELVS